MSEPSPESRRDSGLPDRAPVVPRPRWVTTLIIGVVLLVAIVVVLHLTGNSPGGPGSHLP